jgi:hypothetical protein
MSCQQLHPGSDVTEFRIFLDALFVGPWVADKKRRGQA